MLNQRKAGAILSYVSIFVGILVSLAYVPLLLRFLSVGDYGVYELVGSIISYLALMDIGLSTTVSRFYVRIETAEGRRPLENMLAMTAIIYIVLTVIAELVCIAIYAAIPTLFGAKLTNEELVLAQQMMVIVAVNCAIVLPGNWLLAVLNANEQFVCTMSTSILKWVLQYILTLVFLSMYRSATTVLIVQVGINLAIVIIQYVFCRIKVKVKAKLHSWDSALAKEVFHFTFLVLVGLLVDQIFWKTGQIILGIVSGATAVAIYGIVCNIVVSGFSRLASGISNVFLPKVTKIAALTSDMTELNQLFYKVGHIQAILVWAICVGFIVLGQDFVQLWVGAGFNDVYLASLVLMLSLCVPHVQSLALSILQAKNKLQFRSAVLVVSAIVNLVVCIPISARYGAIGCAVTTALILFVMNVFVMNVYYSRVMKIDIKGFYLKAASLLPALLVSGFVVAIFKWVVGGIDNWALFGFACLLFIALYFAFLWLYGFTQEEKGYVRSMAAGLLRKRSA